VALAAVVNFAGDCVLVLGLKQGAVGAAWSAAVAQVMAWAVLAGPHA
jgi:Na+-driven multidrug efflux pump